MTPVPPATQLRRQRAPGLVRPELAGPELAGPELAGPELAGPELAGPELAAPFRLPGASGAPGPAGPGAGAPGPGELGRQGQAKAGVESPEPHLRVVPPRRRRWASRRLVVYGLVGCAIAVAFGLVSLHVMIAEAQFRLDHLQQQAAAYQARYEKLQLQVALDEAPSRIAQLALENGLQQPASVTYLPAPAQRPSSASAAEGTGQRGQHRARVGTSATGSGTVTAPAGTGDWPSLKPYLSATP